MSGSTTVAYALLRKRAFAVLRCQKIPLCGALQLGGKPPKPPSPFRIGPSDQSEKAKDQSWARGAHVWSKRGISYFASTSGVTTVCATPYKPRYEGEYGNVGVKDLARPVMADFLFRSLPVVDEHNKLRQAILKLEKCWPTRCCWTRLTLTLLGQCVVDFFCVMQFKCPLRFGEMTILEFADELVGMLPTTKNWSPPAATGDALVRTKKRKAPPASRTRSSAVSSPSKRLTYTSQVTCWVCRRYVSNPKQTTWRCTKCNKPLCKVVRTDGPIGRPSCLHEHQTGTDSAVGCSGWYTRSQFPKTSRWFGWK